MESLTPIEICRHADELFQGKDTLDGRVHSVFNRACNLEFESAPLVGLLAEPLPVKPMAISIAPRARPPAGGWELQRTLAPGQVVVCQNQVLSFPASGLSLSLAGARVVDCGPVFLDFASSPADREQNLTVVMEVLLTGNPAGLLPVIERLPLRSLARGDSLPQNAYSAYAWPHISSLVGAARSMDSEGVTRAAGHLAGCGPGLSPAGDDFLSGWMLNAIYAAHFGPWPALAVQAMNAAILAGAKGKTSRLSFEMMSFAAGGEASRPVHALLEALYSPGGSGMAEKARQVLAYGETSGADLLAGIVLGAVKP